jgi:hypothetical protein
MALRLARGKLGLKGKKKICVKDKPESEAVRMTTRVFKSADENNIWPLDEIWRSLQEDMVSWTNQLRSVNNENDAYRVEERLREIEQMSSLKRRLLMTELFNRRLSWRWQAAS